MTALNLVTASNNTAWNLTITIGGRFMERAYNVIASSCTAYSKLREEPDTYCTIPGIDQPTNAVRGQLRIIMF